MPESWAFPLAASLGLSGWLGGLTGFAKSFSDMGYLSKGKKNYGENNPYRQANL
jgi:hypothetical protein